ncbi:MAG TPA: hypothetical protein DEA22_12210 [Blastocatellia bacterium]|nr:hypothetical protein [Blastocatellia bacterium]
MVNRINTNVTHEKNGIPEKGNLNLIGQASISQSRKSSGIELPANDDLIHSLSDSYENQRERQVLEWERKRIGSYQGAA